jgi:hypothetical protein
MVDVQRLEPRTVHTTQCFEATVHSTIAQPNEPNSITANEQNEKGATATTSRTRTCGAVLAIV